MALYKVVSMRSAYFASPVIRSIRQFHMMLPIAAQLGIGTQVGQLEVLAERFPFPATADSTGHVHPALGHVGPEPFERCRDRFVASLGVDVCRSGGEVDLAHRMADDRRLAERDVVL